MRARALALLDTLLDGGDMKEDAGRPRVSPESYGRWALICGASEGLGEAFAHEAAARGFNLFMVARRQGLLESSAERLRQRHGVTVRTLSLDLAEPGASHGLQAATADIEVGLLIYNAALSVSGDYLDVPLETHQRALQVNCLTLLGVVHWLGQAMRARGRGGIVLVSSLSGTVGTACLATYSGTKAFNNVFGEALWDELRGDNVDVVVSWAGATLTPGFEQRKPARLPRLAPRPMVPRAVAADALGALGRRPRSIPGLGNRFVSFLMGHFMSRRQAVETMGSAGRAVHKGSR